jgi:hypothetical protein
MSVEYSNYNENGINEDNIENDELLMPFVQKSSILTTFEKIERFPRKTLAKFIEPYNTEFGHDDLIKIELLKKCITRCSDDVRSYMYYMNKQILIYDCYQLLTKTYMNEKDDMNKESQYNNIVNEQLNKNIENSYHIFIFDTYKLTLSYNFEYISSPKVYDNHMIINVNKNNNIPTLLIYDLSKKLKNYKLFTYRHNNKSDGYFSKSDGYSTRLKNSAIFINGNIAELNILNIDEYKTPKNLINKQDHDNNITTQEKSIDEQYEDNISNDKSYLYDLYDLYDLYNQHNENLSNQHNENLSNEQINKYIQKLIFEYINKYIQKCIFEVKCYTYYLNNNIKNIIICNCNNSNILSDKQKIFENPPSEYFFIFIENFYKTNNDAIINRSNLLNQYILPASVYKNNCMIIKCYLDNTNGIVDNLITNLVEKLKKINTSKEYKYYSMPCNSYNKNIDDTKIKKCIENQTYSEFPKDTQTTQLIENTQTTQLIENTQNTETAQQGGSYYDKYMKYKIKYLHLIQSKNIK